MQTNFSNEKKAPSVNELSTLDTELIDYLGSNHPRRKYEFLVGNTSPHSAVSRKKVMELVNPEKKSAFLSIELHLRHFKNLVCQRTWRAVRVQPNSSTLFLAFGDSHVEFLSRINFTDPTSRALACWLGPLLAYTYSTSNEIMQKVETIATSMLVRLRCRRLVLIVSVGEIDIRSHSWAQVNLYGNFAGVEEYSKTLAVGVVSRTRMLIDYLRKNSLFDNMAVILMEPPPPGRRAHSEPSTRDPLAGLRANIEFPTFGPPEFRLAAQTAYLAHLRSLITTSDNQIRVVGLRKDCSDCDGTLAKDASSDGCHISSVRLIAGNFENIIKELQLCHIH